MSSLTDMMGSANSSQLRDSTLSVNRQQNHGPRFQFMASTSASRAQCVPLHQPSQPSTPIPTDGSIAKRKGWMASAGKHLHLGNTSGSRKESRRLGKALNDSNIFPVSASSWLQKKASHQGETYLNAQTSRKPSGPLSTPILPPNNTPCNVPPRRGSPPDKPLPSLPVATIMSRSPIHRRSIIDAAEKPLQRTVSPGPGTVAHVDWPTLSPWRPTSTSTVTNLENVRNRIGASKRSSSLSLESTLAIQKANGQAVCSEVDHLCPDYTASPLGQKRASSTATQVLRVEADSISLTGANSHKKQRLSSKTNPAQVTSSRVSSMEKSFRSMDIPSRSGVRQTRTSSLRTCLSAGSQPCPRGHTDRGSPSVQNTSQKSRTETSAIAALHFPKHSIIRGSNCSSTRPCLSINGRGSPYDQSIPSQVNLVNVKNSRSIEGKMETDSDVIERRDSRTSVMSFISSEIVAGEEHRPSNSISCQNPLVLPSCVPGGDTEGDSEAEALNSKPAGLAAGLVLAQEHGTEDRDIDTDKDAKHSESFTDPIAPPNLQVESYEVEPDASGSKALFKVNGNSGMRSQQNSSECKPPGYRVRHLSSVAPKHGPTLRISDTADRIILGVGEANEEFEKVKKSHRRSSVPDLRRSTALKDSFRRSIQGLPLTRSLTGRSLNKYDQSVEDDNDDAVVDGGELKHVHDWSAPATPRAEIRFSNLEEDERWNQPTNDPSNNIVSFHDEWPLTNTHTRTTALNSIDYRSLDDESSWISPLAGKSDTMNNGSHESISPAAPHVPDNASAALDDSSPLQVTTHENGEKGNDLGDRITSASEAPPHVSSTNTNHLAYSPRYPSQLQMNASATICDNKTGRDVTSIADSHSMHSLGSTLSACQTGLRSESLTRHENLDSETIRNLNAELQAARSSQILKLDIKPSFTSNGQPTNKGLLSNVRGLFLKRPTEHSLSTGALHGSKRGKNVTACHKSGSLSVGKAAFSPNCSSLLSPHPCVTSPTNSMFGIPSSDHHEASAATRIAMKVLDMAKAETNPAAKANLIGLGRGMVQAITAANDAERAMEEAKQAAARAEIHALQAKKTVAECTDVIGKLMLGE